MPVQQVSSAARMDLRQLEPVLGDRIAAAYNFANCKDLEAPTLGLVPKEVLAAIIKDSWKRRREAVAGPPRLSLEEQAFFQSFEEQMERRG
jgi:hypothetical protein